MYILCGDRFVEYDENGIPIYRYEQFGFLEVVKVVAAGFQCSVVSDEGMVTKIWNCRWDMADRYFKYKPALLDRLKNYTPDKEFLAEYLDNSRLLALYEDKDSRLPFTYHE